MNPFSRLLVTCFLTTLVFGRGALSENKSEFNSNAELPSKGRSIFDHLISRNNNQVPYPFDALIDLIKREGKTNVLAAFIPDGRSLQRFVTDTSSPRVVITGSGSASRLGFSPPTGVAKLSVTEHFQALPTERLFIGYSPNAKTLEIISFNELLGRFEFQLVTDYGPGLSPKTQYAPRQLCVSCHQGGIPIFPHSPWQETDNLEFVVKKLKDLKEHYGLRPNGFSTAPSDIADFDRGVRNAELLENFRRVWELGCTGEDHSECRKRILRAALSAYFYTENGNYQMLETIESDLRRYLIAKWPKNGVPLVNSSILSDRDPAQYPNSGVLPEHLDPLTARSTGTLGVYSVEEMKQSLRPDAVRQVFGLVPHWLSNRNLHVLKSQLGGDPRKLEQALADSSLSHYFDGPLPSATDLTVGILKSVGVSLPNEPWVHQTQAMPSLKAVYLEETPEKEAHPKYPSLHYFKKYCAQCHTNQPELRMNFMTEANDAKLWTNLVNNPEILRRINYETTPDAQRMPPATSPLGKLFREEGGLQRIKMMEDLRNSKSNGLCVDGFSGLFPNKKKHGQIR